MVDSASVRNDFKKKIIAISTPLLLCGFTLTHFYFVNFIELSVGELLLTLAEVFGMVGVLLALAWRVLRDVNKSSLLTYLALLCFFGHERVTYYLLRFSARSNAEVALKGFTEAPMALRLGVFWGLVLLTLVVATALLRVKRDLYPVTLFLFRFSAIVLLLTVTTGLHTALTYPRPVLPVPEAHRTDHKPDIYILLLDGFGRRDVLEKHYGFSTEKMETFLRRMGFRVFTRSRSNYPTTGCSFPCELNFSYVDLESLGLGPDYPYSYAYPLTTVWENNRLSRFLKSQGYQIVNVFGGSSRRFTTTDLALGSKDTINPFGYTFFRHTPVELFFGRQLHIPELRRRRKVVMEAITDFRTIQPKLRHPCFVTVHILCPHEPFFVDEAGGEPYNDPSFDWEGSHDFAGGYAGQAKYLASQLEIWIPELLKASPQEPVIIVQGDHGPAPLATELREQVRQRYPNLCAIYLPGQDYSEFSETITPVNYFRYILNRYFDTRLPILPDRSFSVRPGRNPFDFEDITDLLESDDSSR